MALERAEPRSVPLGTMNGPRTPGSWRFRPQSSREVRRDDGAAQRDRLGAALRAGHGTGALFGFSLSSGLEPTLRLLSRDPTSVRWAARVFTTAYERPQWSWTLEGDPSGIFRGLAWRSRTSVAQPAPFGGGWGTDDRRGRPRVQRPPPGGPVRLVGSPAHADPPAMVGRRPSRARASSATSWA